MTDDRCCMPRCRQIPCVTYLGEPMCQSHYHARLDAIERDRERARQLLLNATTGTKADATERLAH